MCGLGIWKTLKMAPMKAAVHVKIPKYAVRLIFKPSLALICSKTHGLEAAVARTFGRHCSLLNIFNQRISFDNLFNDLILHYSICPKLWAQEPAVETIVLSSMNVSRAKTDVDRICVPFCCWNKTVPLIRKAPRRRVDSTVYELDKKNNNNNRVVIMTR